MDGINSLLTANKKEERHAEEFQYASELRVFVEEASLVLTRQMASNTTLKNIDSGPISLAGGSSRSCTCFLLKKCDWGTGGVVEVKGG